MNQHSCRIQFPLPNLLLGHGEQLCHAAHMLSVSVVLGRQRGILLLRTRLTLISLRLVIPPAPQAHRVALQPHRPQHRPLQLRYPSHIRTLDPVILLPIPDSRHCNNLP